METEFADAQDNWHKLILMKHRIARLIFGFGVGLLVAYLAFGWITNPAPRAERQLEESAVMAARQQLRQKLEGVDLELVDPLLANRAIGKAYVYRADSGWEVSGFYRRGEDDRWHPYLMTLDGQMKLKRLKVQDTALAGPAENDATLEIVQ